MSDQATVGDENEQERLGEDPLRQGTSYDEKKFVRDLLEACSRY